MPAGADGRHGPLRRPQPQHDRRGLSFGIIQWAQRPGRLGGLLGQLQAAAPGPFAEVFAAGDRDLAGRLVAHARKPNGGVNSAGETMDPAFNLVEEPWPSRFRQAALTGAFQRVQVESAVAAFEASCRAILVAVPEAVTERAVAFLLDVANQFGDGGMRQLCTAVRRPGMGLPDLLEAMADESVDACRTNSKWACVPGATHSSIRRCSRRLPFEPAQVTAPAE